MKSIKIIFSILVIFLKTGNNLSADNLFYVNNVEIFKKKSSNTEVLANEAIKKGFKELINKVLLKKDQQKLSDLSFSNIKELISHYQIIETDKESEKKNILLFNIKFDQYKIHNLFYKRGILYSDISRDELYLLPILKKGDQIFIYSKNYFYENWNTTRKYDFIEFILPIENIEIIQILNSNSNNLFNVEIKEIFNEYGNKNTALIFIEEDNSEIEKIFIKTKIMGKNINKSLLIKDSNLSQEQLYSKIIDETKYEIVNLVKSQNLIDVRTPSFINVNFLSSKKNNLVDLSKRLKRIELIENIYVQELNSKYVTLKIKYLGKIDKIIKKMESQNIIMKFTNDQWNLSIKK